LGKFEFLEVVALHNSYAEDVCGCEEPASPAASLICDRGAFEGDLDVEYLLVFYVSCSACEDGFGVCGTEGAEGEAVLGVLEEFVFPLDYSGSQSLLADERISVSRAYGQLWKHLGVLGANVSNVYLGTV